jgi:hypothetical protein
MQADHHVARFSLAISRAIAPFVSTAAIVLAATVPGAIALAAFAPAASAAQRSTGGASSTVVPGGATALSATSLEELLANVRVGGAGGMTLGQLEAPVLANQLAAVSGVHALSGLPFLGGVSGLESALQQAIEKGVSAEAPLGQLLSAKGLAKGLTESLTSAIGSPAEPAVQLLLKKSVEEVLAEGFATTTVAGLLEAQLAQAKNPTQLAGAVMAAANPTTVHTLVGSAPTTEPVESVTLGELAVRLGITPQALAEALGKTTATLPASTPAAVSTLQDGRELALLRGVDGLTAGLLTKATELPETLEETVGGVPGGAKGSAGAGGGAGGGTTVVDSTSSGGSTTIVAGSPATAPPSAAPSLHAATPVAKLKLVSRRVKGSAVTLVLQVPAAGRLHVGARGMRSITRTLPRAGRVTVRIGLTKTRAAQWRRHGRRRLNVTPKASFVAVGGAKSSLATRVALR